MCWSAKLAPFEVGVHKRAAQKILQRAVRLHICETRMAGLDSRLGRKWRILLWINLGAGEDGTIHCRLGFQLGNITLEHISSSVKEHSQKLNFASFMGKSLVYFVQLDLICRRYHLVNLDQIPLYLKVSPVSSKYRRGFGQVGAWEGLGCGLCWHLTGLTPPISLI